MKLTIKSQGQDKVVDLSKDLQFNVSKGEQYIFSNGFTSYVLSFKDNQKSVELTFKVDGKTIKVELKGIVPFLQENIEGMQNPTLVIINKSLNEKEVDNIVNNDNFNGSEIIDRLEALLSQPVDLGSAGPNDKMAIISNFQSLVETLDAAAAGGEQGGNSNGSTFNSIFSSINDSLNGIADTDRWVNLTESISSIPVDTGNTIAQVEAEPEAVIVPKDPKDPIVEVPKDPNDPTKPLDPKDPSVGTKGAVAIEGNDLVFTVTVTQSVNVQTYDFKITDGTATLGEDYTSNNVVFTNGVTYDAVTGKITVPAGVTAFEVNVKTIDDAIIENTESLTVSVGTSSAVGYILDNDIEGITIDPNPDPKDPNDPKDLDSKGAKVTEGDTAEFKVTLTESSSDQVVNVAIAGGSATKGADFLNASETESITVKYADGSIVTIAANVDGTYSVPVKAGQTNFVVQVKTFDDAIIENEENFTLTVKVADKQATSTGTILDNDKPEAVIVPKDPKDPIVEVPKDPNDPTKPLDPKDPSVGTKGAVAIEGNDLVFTVTVTQSVNVQTYDFKITDGTATLGEDYTSNNVVFTNGVTYDAVTGKITVPAGVTAFEVNVKTIDDAIIENTESLTVSVGTSSAVGYILDNDIEGITIDPNPDPKDPNDPKDLDSKGAKVTEGDTAEFKVTLTESSSDQVVNVAIAGGSATKGADFLNASETESITVKYADGSIVTIAANVDGTYSVPVKAGQTNFVVQVKTFDDAIIENEENFTLTVKVADKQATSTGTILDNDKPEAVIVPKDPKDPIVEVPKDPNDPTKPLDPKDPSVGTKGAVAIEGNDLVFTVTVTQSVNVQTYDFKITDGTATLGEDYTSNNVVFTNGVTYDAVTGKITVPAGVTAFEVNVKTIDDAIIENTESLTVSVGTSSAVGYILDNDIEGITIDPNPDPKDPNDPKDLDSKGAKVTEGDTAEFKVTLTESSSDQVVNVAIAGGSATKGADFLNASETESITVKYADGSIVTIAANVDGTYSVPVKAGQTNFVVQVKTFDDAIIENEENFTLTVKVADKQATSTGTILDNDKPEAVIVPKDPKDPIVEVPKDPNDPTKPLDPKDPSVGTKGAVAIEGNDLVFTVTVTQSVNVQTYDFKITDGTATLGEDYTSNNVVFTNGVTYDAVTGKITVPAGVTAFEVNVKTIDDAIIENTESLTVSVGTSSAVGYILDNDIEGITIDPNPDPKDPNDPKDLDSKGAKVTEGDTAEFKVTLTESSSDQVVNVAIAGGSATKGADFLNASETESITVKYADGSIVTIAANVDGTYSVPVKAGQTNFVVQVKTFDDAIIENEENFTLTVKVADKQATSTGTILDNDKPEAVIVPKDPKDPIVEVPKDPNDPTKPLDPKDPSVGTKGAVAIEGNDLVFTVTVTQSVNVQTYDFKITDGTATLGEDYTSNNVVFTNGVTYDAVTGKITVPAGVTAFEVNVKTIDDAIIENTESLTVSVGTSSAVGYILDNDIEGITIDPNPDPKDPNDPKDLDSKGAKVTEGDTAEFKVTLTESSSDQVVNVAIAGGSATKGADFLNASETESITVKYADGSIVTIAANVDGTYSVPVKAGQTNFVVQVKTFDDAIIENEENFTLTVKVADKQATSTGTILDNDKPEAVIVPKDPKDPIVEVPKDPNDPTKPLDPKDPSVGTKGAVAIEGNDLVFTVTVTQSVNVQTYDFKITDGTATLGEDYTSNNVVFTNGVTYDAVTGKITVPAGVTAFEVNVKTIDDAIIENTESLTVSVGTSSAVGYILDNDIEGITIDPNPDPKDPNDPKDLDSKGAKVTEGDTAEFKVTLTESSSDQVVNVAIAGGSATKGADFLNASETESITVKYADGSIVTIAANVDGTYSVPVKAGQTNFVVQVKTFDDAIIENEENFTLTVKVADKQATSTGTILDNDKPEAVIVPKDPKDPIVEVPKDPNDPTKPLDPKDPSVGTKGAVAIEGNDLVFTVTVTQSVNVQTYDFKITDGTATLGEDYTSNNVVFTNGVTYDAVTGKITVPAGVTAFEVNVKTIDDAIIENTESLTVSVGTSSAVGYILDNDIEGITIDPNPDPKDPNDPKDLDSKGAKVTEGDTAEFKVTLTESSSDQVVNVAIAGGSATKGADFLNASETESITVKYADGSIVTIAANVDGTYSVPVKAGQTNFVVQVKTFDDAIIENEENFTLTVKVADKQATSTGTILDNDKPEAVIVPKDPKDPIVEVPKDPNDPTKPLDPKDPSVGTKGAVAIEGNDLVFTVTVTQSVNVQTYDFKITDGTATLGEDYTSNNVVFTNGVTYDAVTGKITVPAGVTAFEVNVKTIDDAIIENTESLTVSVGTSSAVGYILDNDIEGITIDPNPDPKDPNDPKDLDSKGAKVTEGDTAEFKVTLTESSSDQVVNVAIAGGSATKGADFLNASETESITVKYADGSIVTIAANVDGTYSVPVKAGQTNFVVQVKTFDDAIIENEENFTLTVKVADKQATSTGTILDNDKPEAVIVPKDPKDPIVEVPKDPNDPTKPLDPKDPSVGTKGAVAIEGNDLVFTVTVTQSVNVQTYDFKITDGTATLGEDYTSNNVVFTNGVTYDAVTGKITVPAGVTAFEVNVKTIDDAIIENTESLTVSVGTSSAVGYILDNDIEGITIDPNPDPKDPNDPKDLDSKGAKVTEGDTAEFKVTLTESSSDQVVNVAIAGGSATKGADFLNASETESITVKYADGSIVTIAANVDGTYSVPVKAGQTNFVVQVKTFDDAIIENEENFTLTVKVADKQATSTGTILDNDKPEAVIVPKDPKDPIVEVPKDPNDPTKPLDPKDPSVGTKGAVAIEGNDLVFTVTVTQSVNVQTYDFKITDGTATLGEDYTSNNVVFTNGVTYDAVTGKITVPAGVTAFEVNVKTIDDAIIENTESLTVSVGTSSAVGYILDNDIEGITIDPNPDPKDPNDPKDLDSKGAKVTEGDTAEFKVTLTESSSDQVVNVAIAGGSATKGADFLNASETESITVKYADGSIVTIAANVDGTYSVPVKAGQTNFVVQVKTFDDAIIENEENFTLTVKVADKQATSTGTILDNDKPEAVIVPKDPKDPIVEVPKDPNDPTKPLDPKDPSVGTKGAVAIEGNDLVFTVTVTQSVNVQTYDFKITDGTATLGEDYTSNNVVFTNGVTYDAVTGKITVPAGVTAFEVNVKTIDDAIIENTESLTVSVGTSSAVGYILDNDIEGITIDPNPDPKDPNDPKDLDSKGAKVTEGDTAEFKVTLTESSSDQVVNVAIAGGSATKGADFLNASETESITVKYADGSIVTIAANVDGTYSVPVKAGQTNFVVQVKTFDDAIIENEENFTLTVKVADKQATSTGTILDNDKPEAVIVPKDPKDPIVEVPKDPNDPTKPLDPKDPSVGTKGAVAIEGNDLVFTVTVTQSVNVQTYDFKITDGTATLGEDYTSNNVVFTNGVTYDAVTGKITVPAGVTAFEVNVKTIDDAIIENTESLTVSVGTSSAVGYILDNDIEGITIDPNPDPKDPNDPKDLDSKGAKVTEGDTAEFKVTLTESSSDQVVNVAIAGGSATKGADFLNASETESITVKYADGSIVTIAANVDGTYSVPVKAGQTNFVVQVKTFDDAIIENEENFTLTVKVADKQATSTGTILDNDKPEAVIVPKDPKDPIVEVPKDPNDPTKPLDPKDPSVGTKGAVAIEGNDLVFTVTVTQSVNVQTYDFKITDGTATLGEDYTSNNVVFTNGVTYDAVTGKITVPAGVTAFEVNVKTIDDAIIENTESLTVSVGTSSAVGYILDNDIEGITIDPNPDPKDPNDPKDLDSKGAKVTEGDTAEFKVTLTESSSDQVVNVAIAGGSATKGADFLNASETESITVKYADGSIVTIAANVDGTYSVPVKAGQTNFVVQVKTFDDAIIENEENFTLTVKVADKQATSTGTILDNDKPEAVIVPKDPKDPIVEVPKDPNDPTKPLDPKDPSVGTKGAVAIEGNDLVFTVTVTQSVNVQTYDFKITDGTATLGEDYTSNNVVFTNGVTYDAVTGKITVPAGVTAFEVNVKTIDDAIIENTESLTVSVGTSSAVGYILDNDIEGITIDPNPDPKDPNDPKDLDSKGAKVTEGDTAEFKVTLTESSSDQVVNVAIAGGSATKGADFLNASETESITVKYADGSIVTIAANVDGTYSVPVKAGQTNFVVQVKTFDDAIIENEENFTLTVKVADKQATSTGTILDNDKPEAVIVPKDPKDPIVEVPKDPNDPTKPLDPKDPSVGTKGAVAIEGNDLVFTVTVTQSVNVQTYDFKITDGTATLGEDYTSNNVVFTNGVTYDAVTGKITVPAGVTAFEVNVKTIDDAIIENTESLTVSVGTSSAVGYILDNDIEGITIDPNPDPKDPNDPKDLDSKGAKVTEGDTAEFKVTLTESSSDQVVNVAIAGGSATKGADFLNASETESITVKYADGSIVTIAANVDGTYSVPVKAGQTNFVVQVKTFDDAIIENEENFTLTVKVADKQATSTGTILDNDKPEAVIVPKDPKDPIVEVPKDPNDPTKPLDPKDPSVGTKGAVAIEGNDLVFTVTVTQSVNVQTYDFKITDGTATLGEDYTSNNVVFTNGVTYDAVTGKITVPAGVTAFEVNVKTIDDAIIENTESLTVSVGTSSAVGYILDNDIEGITIDPNPDPKDPNDPKDLDSKGAKVTEGDTAEFKVTLTESSSDQVVNVAIAGGSATKGADFLNASETESITVKYADGSIVTIAANVDGTYSVPVKAGQTNFVVQVKTFDDAIIENEENFTLTVKVADKQATSTGTILDNDKPEAVIVPKDPKDPIVEVPKDPNDPTKPLDPKDPSVGTKGAVAIEGNDLVFTVTVTQSVNVQTYDFKITDGTATLGEDYTSNNVVFTNGVTYDAVTGKITVPAGVTAFEVNVKTIDDAIIENTESLTVSVGTSSAVGYILDNDIEGITIDPNPDPKDPNDPKDLDSKGAKVTEGDTAEFKVTLTESSSDQVVNVAIAGGSATKGADFLNASETESITVKYADGSIVTIAANVDGTYSVPVKAGQTNFVVQVKTFDDAIIENEENFTLTVKVADKQATSTGTILDNDKPEAVIVPKDPKDPIVEVPKDPNDPTKPLDPKDPSVGTKGAVAIEGNDLVFTVTVTQSVNVQTYDFKITDGTATLGEDYTSNNVVFTNGVTYDAVTGKITVPAGVTAFEVNVKTIDDAIIENTESLTVSVGTSSAVGYILDNDIEGITIDPNPDPKDPNDPKDLDSKGAKVTEGDTAEFKVTLTESSSDQVVNVAIAGGSATKGADFLNASETESITVKYADGSIVTIAANVDGTYSVPVKAGQTNFVVQVKTFDDAIIENEENFTLTVKVADKQATSTGTILDNDKPEAVIVPKDPKDPIVEVPKDPNDPTKPLDPKDPSVGTKGAVAIEGNDLVFTVTVTQSVNVQTYDFKITDGTATLGEDYTSNNVVFTNGVTYDAVTGKITVPAGVTAFEVNVKTIDDAIIENTESLTVSVGTSSAVGYILDNDIEGITIDPNPDPKDPNDPKDLDSKGAKVTEGDTAEFKVTLTESSSDQVVNVAIAGGSATKGADFLNASETESITVKYADGSIVTIAANVDGTYSVPVKAGQTNFVVQVKTFDDAIIENEENFTLTVKVADKQATSTGTILDNDKPEAVIVPKDPKDPIVEVPKDPNDPTKPLDPKDPSVGTKGAVAIEGNDLVFTVTVTQSVNVQTYDFKITDGTATLGEDYTSNNVVFTNGVTYDAVTGKITVPAGVTAFEVNVKTIDDAIIENTESLTVSVGTSSAVGYILDNDIEGITIDPNPDPKDPNDPKDLDSKGAKVTEGDTAEFKVTLTESSSDQVVNVAIAGGSATKGADFLNASETESITVKYADGSIVTIAANVDGTYSVPVKAGQTNFVVQVKTFDDAIIENEENFTLTVKVADKQATSTGTILDNDKPEAVIVPKDPKDPIVEVPKDPNDPTKPLDPKDPSVGTKGAVAIEGNDLVFTVTVTQSVNVQTYDFKITDGTATLGEDYTSNNVVFTNGVTYDAVTGKITVPAGVTAFEVNVKTIDDAIIENTESLTVSVGTSSAVGYILDNDIEGITIDPNPDPKDPNDPKDLDSKGAKVTEGDTAEFKVTLTESSSDQVVNVAIAGGSATKGADFLNASETESITVKYADGSIVTIAANVDGTYSVPVKAGQTNFVVQVKTFDDAIIENEENFTLTVKVADKQATSTGTILDNDVPMPPVIEVETICVHEKGLDNGTSKGDGSNITTGEFKLTSFYGLSSVIIAGTTINVSDLMAGNNIPTIAVPNGELKITGYDDGKVSYEYTLTQAHNHDKSKGEDELAFKDISIKAVDVNGDITTANIKLGIHDDNPRTSIDDSEAGGQILVVPIGTVDIGNIQAGFTKWTGGDNNTKAVNTDLIPGKDTLTWGTKNGVSGYDFKANTEYKNLAIDVINNQLNLGVFTHTNKPITAGTEIKTTVLTVELDVVIDGKSVHIKHDISIKHNETPNNGTAEQNKDIVTIEQSSFSQVINVGGKEYLFVIDGFLDKNGNVVKEVRTWEDGDAPKGQTNYNSFELFASIVSTDPLPKIEGSAFGDDAGSNAIFGADGAAKNNAIVWANGVALANGSTKVVGEYGTLIVDKNGNYEFELNRKTYDNFKDEKTATFKYTVTDADGDTRDSFVNIKLNGAVYENVDTIGRTIEGSNGSDIIFGSEGNDYIYGGAGNDEIHSGAGRDVIYGGAGNDTIYTDLSTKNGQTYGDVFIDGGTGYDKLILEGNNDIDLSVIKDKISIKNIEEIDLTQGDHTLKNLKLDDVIDLTDGKNELYVKGNLGDKVELDLNEWNVQSTNKGYTEYIGKGEHSTVKLIIDDEIDIHNI